MKCRPEGYSRWLDHSRTSVEIRGTVPAAGEHHWCTTASHDHVCVEPEGSAKFGATTKKVR